MHLQEVSKIFICDGTGSWVWVLTCVANTSVVDLDTDFVGSWGSYFDVFDGEVLAGFPSNGSLC